MSDELQPGTVVLITGPDYAGDNDDLGVTGTVSYSRGGYQYWIRYQTGPHAGLGTTYDRESLEPMGHITDERWKVLRASPDAHQAARSDADV